MKHFFVYFLLWLLFVSIFCVFVSFLFPLQNNYLGGGIQRYMENPYLWWHSNFDGEHYLEIAMLGYRPLQYFFFPVFPLLLGAISKNLNLLAPELVFCGTVISIVSTFLAMVVFYKLIRLDYKKSIAISAVVLMLVFPTSFYYQAVYTEGLFFLLSVASIYFSRKDKWAYSTSLAVLASATRLIGVVLFFSLLFEWITKNKTQKATDYKSLFLIMLVPLGLVAYMVYLKNETGDPLAFFHNVAIFGQQRSSSFVMLPQVFYRYFFKIIPASSSYWASFSMTLLELATGILFLILCIVSFFKQRGSYALFLLGGYIIPTLSGSFSSLPRYVLPLFPAFILISVWLDKKSNTVKWLVYGSSGALLLLFCCMFIRGYFVS